MHLRPGTCPCRRAAVVPGPGAALHPREMAPCGGGGLLPPPDSPGARGTGREWKGRVGPGGRGHAGHRAGVLPAPAHRCPAGLGRKQRSRQGLAQAQGCTAHSFSCSPLAGRTRPQEVTRETSCHGNEGSFLAACRPRARSSCQAGSAAGRGAQARCQPALLPQSPLPCISIGCPSPSCPPCPPPCGTVSQDLLSQEQQGRSR